jgi:hypothetical protein
MTNPASIGHKRKKERAAAPIFHKLVSILDALDRLDAERHPERPMSVILAPLDAGSLTAMEQC